MTTANRGFVTPDGRYYEAASPLASDHREVGPRQHAEPAPPQQPEVVHHLQEPRLQYQPPPNTPYVLNQDSQFNFKLKDVIIIAGAIASAAVSWNSADGRLSRLEDRVSTDIVKKIEAVERKQDEAVKYQADSIKALSAQIADLERAIASRK